MTDSAAPAGAAWTARVLTLYPEMFPGPLGHSLAGRAMETGIWALETVDIRDFAGNKHRTVDDAPCPGPPTSPAPGSTRCVSRCGVPA